MKVKNILKIHTLLLECSNLTGKAAYVVARNLKSLKPIVEEFTENNKLRVLAFAKKDEEGQPIIIEGRYDFGDKAEEAGKEWETLLNKEVDFTPIITEYSAELESIPAGILTELLDIIFI